MANNNTNFLITFITQGAQAAVTSAQQVGSALNSVVIPADRVSSSMKQLSGSNTTLAGAMAKVGERALITIPVWLALRAAFIGTIKAFDDSVKSIVEMDTALKHLEMQLVGTKNAADTVAQVKIQAQNLAIQTGESPAELINVFNQLYTVGFKVQDAFAGMKTAAQGALAENTNAKDVANVLINTYKELGSTITAVHSPADKLNFIMSTMAVLMNKNNLTVKDFEDSLKTFAGQAKQSNLTIDETLSLIAAEANVSQTGTFAGRGMTGIFRQITNQRAGVEDLLGKSTSGQSDWQTFLDVINKIQSIKPNDTQGIEAVSKIFSLRGGGQAIRALAEDAQHLKDNLQLLYSLTPDERQAVFAERLSLALAQIVHQADITKQIMENLGRTFITAAAGTDDFAGGLKKLNQMLLDMKPAAEGAGEAVHGLITLIQGSGITGLLSGFNSGNIKSLNSGPSWLPGQSTSNNPLQNLFSAISPMNIFTALGLSDDTIDKQGWATLSTALNPVSRKKAPLGSAQSVAQTAAGVGSTTPQEDPKIQQQIFDLKKQEREVEKDLQSLGYTRLQILNQELQSLIKQGDYGTNALEIEKKRLEIATEYAAEVDKAATSFQSSAEKGLTDLFMGNVKVPKGSKLGAFGAISAQMGDNMRQQTDSAFAGNITSHLFGNTGLSKLFGQQVTSIRNGGTNDPTYLGAYKGTYDGVTAAFTGKTGGSGAVAVSGASSTSSVLNQIIKGSPTSLTSAINTFTGANSGASSPLAWPGVSPMTYDPGIAADYFSANVGKGNGGNFAGGNMGTGNIPSMFSYVSGGSSPVSSSAKGVAATGSSPMTSVNSFIQKYMGIKSDGTFGGTIPGFGKGGIMNTPLFGTDGQSTPFTAAGTIGALAQGFGTYSSLGGAQGSMALPSSILGTMGSIADMIPGGQVIGGAMQLIGGILGLFNTKKTVTDQVSTHQVSSKLDESNKQLTMINRNLVAMKSSIDTYIMPNSAYFATKGNLSDQFALDQQRA